MIIYLDESGDLGFDFKSKNPSCYFVIAVLVCKDAAADKRLQNAVNRTIKNKLGYGETELKGTKTEFNIKTYFWGQLNKLKVKDFEIFSVVVEKGKLLASDIQNKQHLYNKITTRLLRQLNFTRLDTLTLIVDKCKDKYEMKIFNEHIKQELNLDIPIFIHHFDSRANKGLLAIDLFCWGIYRKYEHGDTQWYQEFEMAIRHEKEY